MTSYGCHPFSRAGLSLHLRPQRRVRVASELDFELLTIDGSGGGTGMSPNDMLDNWGVPSVLLHAKAHDYAFLRAAAGKKVVDLAVGGGLLAVVLLYEKLRKTDAMGGGDIKLLCLTGLYLGWMKNLLCLLLACVLGIVFALVTLKRRGTEGDARLTPWGPSISAAAILTLLWGDAITAAYLSLF